jgi:hypothetical protein
MLRWIGVYNKSYSVDDAGTIVRSSGVEPSALIDNLLLASGAFFEKANRKRSTSLTKVSRLVKQQDQS